MGKWEVMMGKWEGLIGKWDGEDGEGGMRVRVREH